MAPPRRVGARQQAAEASILAGEHFTLGSRDPKLALHGIDLLGQQKDLARFGADRVSGQDLARVLCQGQPGGHPPQAERQGVRLTGARRVPVVLLAERQILVCHGVWAIRAPRTRGSTGQAYPVCTAAPHLSVDLASRIHSRKKLGKPRRAGLIANSCPKHGRGPAAWVLDRSVAGQEPQNALPRADIDAAVPCVGFVAHSSNYRRPTVMTTDGRLPGSGKQGGARNRVASARPASACMVRRRSTVRFRNGAPQELTC